LWDSEGWALHGKDSRPVHATRMIRGSDNDSSIWYFSAPQKFLGDKRSAYGGELQFKLGFFEYNSEGQNAIVAADVILVSEKQKLVAVKKDVVPAWSFQSENAVVLKESAGWKLNGTDMTLSRPEFLR
jgi:predicted cupin superfamily sugar epimerase